MLRNKKQAVASAALIGRLRTVLPRPIFGPLEDRNTKT